jgi:hypothetical protein
MINNNNCDQQSVNRHSMTSVPQNHHQSQSNDGTILRNMSLAPPQRCVSLNKDFHRDNDINSSHEESSSPEETSSESSEWESGELAS